MGDVGLGDRDCAFVGDVADKYPLVNRGQAYGQNQTQKVNEGMFAEVLYDLQPEVAIKVDLDGQMNDAARIRQ